MGVGADSANSRCCAVVRWARPIGHHSQKSSKRLEAVEKTIGFLKLTAYCSIFFCLVTRVNVFQL